MACVSPSRVYPCCGCVCWCVGAVGICAAAAVCDCGCSVLGSVPPVAVVGPSPLLGRLLVVGVAVVSFPICCGSVPVAVWLLLAACR